MIGFGKAGKADRATKQKRQAKQTKLQNRKADKTEKAKKTARDSNAGGFHSDITEDLSVVRTPKEGEQVFKQKGRAPFSASVRH